MKAIILSILITLLFLAPAKSQNVLTTSRGEISFFSSAPLEDIKADNSKVNAALNSDTGEILIRLLIKDFEFRRSLMQKHFNENYMESDKYPVAVFSGKIIDFDSASNQTNYTVKGELTIRDITHQVKNEATIEKKGRSYICHTKFPIILEDYDIKIPRIMMRNIAEEVEVTANFTLE